MGCHGKKLKWAGIALALGGLGIGLGIAAKKKRTAKLVEFEHALQDRYGPDGQHLAGQLREQYNTLYAARIHFNEPELREHMDENILPGLALYYVLRKNKLEWTQDTLLDEMEQIFTQVFAKSAKIMSLLGHLPDPFAAFRRLMPLAMRFGFGSPGWETEWIEESDQCVGFDMRRCFYLNALSAYGVPELTPLYCKMDDLTGQALPPSIVWKRTSTLGRGDACCDFRWCQGS